MHLPFCRAINILFLEFCYIQTSEVCRRTLLCVAGPLPRRRTIESRSIESRSMMLPYPRTIEHIIQSEVASPSRPHQHVPHASREPPPRESAIPYSASPQRKKVEQARRVASQASVDFVRASSAFAVARDALTLVRANHGESSTAVDETLLLVARHTRNPDASLGLLEFKRLLEEAAPDVSNTQVLSLFRVRDLTDSGTISCSDVFHVLSGLRDRPAEAVEERRGLKPRTLFSSEPTSPTSVVAFF